MDTLIKVAKSVGVLGAAIIAWYITILAQPYLPDIFLAAPFVYLMGAIGTIYEIFTGI